MKSRIRSEGGFSLPTIIGLGVVAGLWVLGTASLIIPTQYRIQKERLADQLRATNEAAVDWAVAQICQDPTNVGNMNTTWQFPTSAWPYSSDLQKNFNGRIEITTAPAPADTYLHNPAKPALPWKIVTATLQRTDTMMGTERRRVRVLLQPTEVAMQTVTPTQVVVPGNPIPIFGGAMAADGDVGGSGNLYTETRDSKDPSYKNQNDKDAPASIFSNTSVALTGNSNVGGEVGAPEGGSISLGSQVVVHQGNSTPAGDPMQMPTMRPPGNYVKDLGAVKLSGKQTLTISQPGDYKITSLDMSGQSTINITTTGKVNFYFEGGSTAGTTSIKLAGQGISNPSGSPANLGIWVPGQGDISLTGQGNMNAVIYAPKSDFKMAGNGQLFGAVIAKTANISGNGTFYYDKQLANNKELFYTPMVTQTQNTVVWQQVVQKYTVVSWDEMEEIAQ
jgi:hypothetical protein